MKEKERKGDMIQSELRKVTLHTGKYEEREKQDRRQKKNSSKKRKKKT